VNRKELLVLTAVINEIWLAVQQGENILCFCSYLFIILIYCYIYSSITTSKMCKGSRSACKPLVICFIEIPH